MALPSKVNLPFLPLLRNNQIEPEAANVQRVRGEKQPDKLGTKKWSPRFGSAPLRHSVRKFPRRQAYPYRAKQTQKLRSAVKLKARPDFSLIARTPLRLFQLASPVTL